MLIAKIIRELQNHLALKSWRYIIGKIRFFYYTKIGSSLRTLESESAVDNTIKHNLKNLSTFGFTRMNSIIRPLSVIELLNENSTFLIIGPRNEEDLLNLVGNGFKLDNITGLDLISYSPKIEVGDMHNMKYADNTFDCVICGWTLLYSNDIPNAVGEMIRVCKDNGIIAIAFEYSDLTNEQQKSKLGYSLNAGGERIKTTKQIFELFGNYVHHIYFNHDAPNKISHTVEKIRKDVSSLVCIFGIKK